MARLSEKAGELRNTPITLWDEAQRPLTGTPVAKFKHLLTRVDTDELARIIEESKEEAPESVSAPVARDSLLLCAQT